MPPPSWSLPCSPSTGQDGILNASFYMMTLYLETICGHSGFHPARLKSPWGQIPGVRYHWVANSVEWPLNNSACSQLPCLPLPPLLYISKPLNCCSCHSSFIVQNKNKILHLAFKTLPKQATSYSLNLSFQSLSLMSSHFPNSRSVVFPCFHFWRSLLLECSLSFWMERRKWHPQHFQNNIYFQGGPAQIHTDKPSWLQQQHCYLSFIPEKLYHKIPFQNAMFVFYHFVTEFWIVPGQESGWNYASTLPVTTWNSRPLPHPHPILLWTSCPVT